MQVVGIDLGTTNLRISTWDSDRPEQIPQPLSIGEGDAYTMPTVVAFRRQPSGEIETIVGEEADSLEDDANQVVIRNVKRYALEHDRYVRQRLEISSSVWPSWWDRDSRCVQVWGREFPVKDLMAAMLKEAFSRAGISSKFEWRAGCPVQAGLKYRSELAEVITELSGIGQGELNRIVEEPILLLALAHQLKKLEPGSSYLVYDLGGGSFDCALAQIDASDDPGQMVIFGAEGDPLIGGSDIDDLLADDLGHENLTQLRRAKEAVSPSNPQNLFGDKTLTWQDYERAVARGLFIFKTTVTMRKSYREAKALWQRTDEATPMGEIIHRNVKTGEVKFTGKLNWEDMAGDLDGIVLCGGPTKSSLFAEALKQRFGDHKIISASDLIPSEIPDPELTAISMGACYAFNNQYGFLYVNRLPVRITLEDRKTGQKAHYEPYEHFSPYSMESVDDFVSSNSLSENPDDPHSDERYELTVATPEGVMIDQCLVDPYINTRLIGSKLKLIINRVGQVGVEQQSDKSAPQKYTVIKYPPWQAGAQRRAFDQLQENIRKQQEKEAEHLQHIIYTNPWGWQENPS